MQFLLWLLVTVVGFMVSLSDAGIVGSLPSDDPAHAGKCWNPDTKTLHEVGEEYTDHKHCVGIKCHSNFSMSWATCGSVAAGPPCHVVKGNLTLNYPDCCPNIECNDEQPELH